MNNKIIFSLLLAISLCYGQISFQSAVEIFDPSITGKLTGTFFYSQAANRIRIDYTGLAGTFQEFFEFGVNVNGAIVNSRYLVCNGVCQGETLRATLVFARVAGDTQVGGAQTINGRSCTQFNKPNPQAGSVSQIFVDASDIPCRAILTTGKRFEFTGPAGLTGSLNKPANCPLPTCTQKQDIMLVFDESGSIDPNSFQIVKNFGISFATGFTFGAQNGAMGLVQFSDGSRLTIPLNQNKQSFLNSMNAVAQAGGFTCIGCGIRTAQIELQGGRGRSGAKKIIVVLTDGANNRGGGAEEFNTAVTNAKNAQMTLVGIGVAGFDLGQIQFIASAPNLAITAANFADLPGRLNALTAVTCDDLPGNPCGAGCRGFCSCNAQCICPVCTNPDSCTIASCNPAVAGAGCTNSARVCNDNNACTANNCNPATGCVFPDISASCNDGLFCTIDSCDPATGCVRSTRDCSDTDPCTVDSCNEAQDRCDHIVDPACQCAIQTVCNPDPNKCKINACNPATGQCQITDKVCNSNNPCITDGCDPVTGNCTRTAVVCNDNNACSDDSCNPASGCVFTFFNVTDRCNDNSVCTDDTCVPATGCVNTLIPSNNTDKCVSQVCNSILGYTFDPLDCSTQFDPNLIGTCYQVSCDSVAGCQLLQLPGTFIDQCGFCVNATGETNPFCFLGLDAGETAGLGAGIIAAIVIAVIAAVVIAGLTGTAGYVAYKRNQRNMQGAQSSPLYNDGGRTGQNPFFSAPN